MADSNMALEVHHIGTYGSPVAQGLAITVSADVNRGGNIALATERLAELRKLDDDAAEVRLIRELHRKGLEVRHFVNDSGTPRVWIRCVGQIGLGLTFKYEGDSLSEVVAKLVASKGEDVLGKDFREVCIDYIQRCANAAGLPSTIGPQEDGT